MAKKKSSQSPTQMTLKLLRDWGWMVQTVEYRQQSWADHLLRDRARDVVAAYREKGSDAKTRTARQQSMAKLADICDTFVPGRKIDLFGFIDIVGLRWNAEQKRCDTVVAIQCTSLDNRGARIRKIKTECIDQAVAWLQTGATIEVWGWHKYADKQKIADPFGVEHGGKRQWRPKMSPITFDDFDMDNIEDARAVAANKAELERRWEQQDKREVSDEEIPF